MSREKNKYRKPTKIEQKTIDKVIKSITKGQKILFFVWLVFLVLISSLLVITIIDYGLSFSHIFLFLLAFALLISVLSSWLIIKDLNVKKSFLVYREKGEWYMHSPKDPRDRFKIIVNDKEIIFPIKRFYKAPKLEKELITYEYVKLFEIPPMFNGEYMFISINDRLLTEKDLA